MNSVEETTLYPPQSIAPSFLKSKRIFLAGSIEMGKATDWQQNFVLNVNAQIYTAENGRFVSQMASPYCFYNPRRKDWDSDWKQGIEEPQFFQQVTWELSALDQATHIVMYFEPGTQSPISLMELGLYANTGKLLVVCPEGFWRKGNVDIVCTKLGIKQFGTLGEAATYVTRQILN
jgi:hypothetical protein